MSTKMSTILTEFIKELESYEAEAERYVDSIMPIQRATKVDSPATNGEKSVRNPAIPPSRRSRAIHHLR